MLDLLVFLPACFALNLAFGPNNLLALTHGAQCGVRFALAASIARLIAFVPLILASALGLSLLLSTSVLVFSVVKIIGAAYLIWLGIKILRSSSASDMAAVVAAKPSLKEGFRSEGLVAISNPKAILIFAAFFPQFVDIGNYWFSYALVGSIFLFLEVFAILIYAATGRFASSFASNRIHWFQKASGLGMIGFGLILLFSRQPNRGVV